MATAKLKTKINVTDLRARNIVQALAQIDQHRLCRDVIPEYHEAFQALGLDALARQSKPVAAMLSLRLNPGKTITQVRLHWQNYYAKGGAAGSDHAAHAPRCKWVREFKTDPVPGSDGKHFHVFVLLDASRVHESLTSLTTALDQITGPGKLLDAHWISRKGYSEGFNPNHSSSPIQVHHLYTDEGFSAYLRHAEYLAKTETKRWDVPGKNLGGSEGIESVQYWRDWELSRRQTQRFIQDMEAAVVGQT